MGIIQAADGVVGMLVTGASGFVGRHAMARMGGMALAEADGTRVDIRRYERVAAAVARVRPDAVLHLAAMSTVTGAHDDAADVYRTNFWGTYNLLRALQEAGFRGRLLYVGSGAVYGDAARLGLPLREDAPLRPTSAYAVSKVAAEALCYQWSRAAEFEIVLARPFNHTGPGQERRFALSDFAAQIAEIKLGRRPPVLSAGNVTVRRDFTDVRDIVAAYALLLQRGANGAVYNVCSGAGRRLEEIIQQLVRLAGVQVRIEVSAERVRDNDASDIHGDCTRIREELGWAPSIPWDRTLRDLLDYWETKLRG